MLRTIAVNAARLYFGMFPPRLHADVNINKILFFAYPGVGDCIMATPTIRTMHKDGKVIDVMVYSDAAEQVFRHNPHVRNIYQGRSLNNLRDIRKEKYDMAVCLNLFSEPIYAYLAGIPIRRGQTNNGYALTHRFVWLPGEHSIDFIPRIAGIEIDDRKPELFLKDEDVPLFGEIVVVPDSGTTEYARKKKWPEHYFAELCNKLNKPITLCGLDRNVSSTVKQELNVLYQDYTGNLNILELASLIKKSTLVISNDSAAMHIAACFDVPCAAIFGPTDPKILAYETTIVNEGVCPYGHEHCFHMNTELENCDRPCLTQVHWNEVYLRIKDYEQKNRTNKFV